MPTFICQELFAQCISQNAGSQSGQRDCKQKIQALCATQSPPKNAASDDDDDDDDATTTLSTATRSATQSAASASATEETVTSTTSDGLAAPTMAPAGKGAAAAVALGMLAYLL